MILEDIFLITVYVGGFMAMLIAFGALIYDTKEIKMKKEISTHPNRRQLKYRPLITVLISVNNNETKIEQCLRKLIKSSYRKFEVIVIDNASLDNSKLIIKRIMNEYPKQNIRLIARRSDKKTLSLSSTFKKYGKGELVLLLDPTSHIDKQTLSNASRHFNLKTDINVLNFKHDVLIEYSLVGLFQKYENILLYSSKKYASITNSNFVMESTDAMYRRDIFMTIFKYPKISYNSSLLKGNMAIRSYFANDAIIYTSPLMTFRELIYRRYVIQRRRAQTLRLQGKIFKNTSSEYSKLLIWLRLTMSMCVGIVAFFIPILLTYFLYMAIELREPTLLILSWVTLGIFLFIAVWGDSQLKFLRKIVFSLFIPMTYGVFYLMSFVQIFAELRGFTMHIDNRITSK